MKMPDQSAVGRSVSKVRWCGGGGGVRGGTAMAQAVSVSSQQLPGPPVPLPLYQPTLVSTM